MTSRWRPKNRRQILQLQDDSSENPTNSSPQPNLTANKLHALLGHYNSDDEEKQGEEIDNQFQDFMKEIKSIDQVKTANSVWQELWDPQSGHPYYWNTVTNELTWDKPQEVISTDSIPKLFPTVPANVVTENNEMNVTFPIKEAATVVQQSKLLDNKQETKSQLDAPTKEILIKDISAAGHETVVNQDKASDCTERSVLTKVTNSEKFPIDQLLGNTKPEKTEGHQAMFYDVDMIIAAIEREIPPDYKPHTEIIPLFRRRKVENGMEPKQKINFKTYFQVNNNISLFEEPENVETQPVAQNDHRGFGYHESESETAASKHDINFVKGETLVPLSHEVKEPNVSTLVAPTFEERMSQIEKYLSVDTSVVDLKLKMAIEFQMLRDMYDKGKIDSNYFESWIASCENNSKETQVKEDAVKENLVNADGSNNQVMDMVLDDSSRESEVSCTEGKLDSALSSFYSDLATLDKEKLNDGEGDVAAGPGDNKKIKKRSKMSQDMSSLVAKWQKIQEETT